MAGSGSSQPKVSLPTAVGKLKTDVQEALNNALAQLLEKKHLYQAISISLDDLIAVLKDRAAAETLQQAKSLTAQWLAGVWIPRHFDPHAAPPLNSATAPAPELLLRPLRLVCPVCKTGQAHTPVTWTDETEAAVQARMVVRTAPKLRSQVLTISYQCQACHSLPTVFIVRREGHRLRLEGRSPMEWLELPAHVPDTEAVFYRDAVMAYNAGKTLAALFYLRTFIERFARRVSGIQKRATGDEIMEEYAATLPEDLRARMPSFRGLYDRLSDALHSAREDSELFESARLEVDNHLDIRRVFTLNAMPEAGTQ